MNEINRLLVSAHLVDARGKACPAPIIELAKALRAHPNVELWADDPAARGDLDAFVAATGHTLVHLGTTGLLRAVVRRKE
ncbi:MAG: sulfurtransferase TusA family protein [Myxococcaceae bacterium]